MRLSILGEPHFIHFVDRSQEKEPRRLYLRTHQLHSPKSDTARGELELGCGTAAQMLEFMNYY